MSKLSKYRRRICITFGQAVAVAGTCIMMLAPWSKGFSHAEENYYTVMVNGNEVGHVADAGEAEDVFEQVCIRLENEQTGVAYVNPKLSIVENDAVMGKYTEKTDLENKMYHELCRSEAEDTTYTLSVEGVQVVLSSLEEVSQVVNEVKDMYDDGKDYQAVITKDAAQDAGTAKCELVQASIEPENRPIVMASEEGVATGEAEFESVFSFVNEVKIVKNHAKDVSVSTVDEAVLQISRTLEVISVR